MIKMTTMYQTNPNVMKKILLNLAFAQINQKGIEETTQIMEGISKFSKKSKMHHDLFDTCHDYVNYPSDDEIIFKD